MNPGKITYGSMSSGVAIAMKYVEAKENLKMTYIPLQSGQETATVLLGGHVHLAIGTAVYQFIESKEIRAIAAATEERMPPPMHEVATMKEQGYDVDITGWMALGAPAGVPKERLEIIFERSPGQDHNE
jgi:putative tricarboxylic transport membrane protein